MNRKRKRVCVQVGRNLRRLRSMAGLTQADLGNRLGLSVQQIQRYESGKNQLNVPMLHRLKCLLGCDYAEFFAGVDGDMPAQDDADFGRQQRVVRRLSRAVLEMSDTALQERFIDLAAVMGKEKAQPEERRVKRTAKA